MCQFDMCVVGMFEIMFDVLFVEFESVVDVYVDSDEIS